MACRIFGAKTVTLTNAGLLLIGPLGTNLSEIWIEIEEFSWKKMNLNLSSSKWQPFCLGLNVLTTGIVKLFRNNCVTWSFFEWQRYGHPVPHAQLCISIPQILILKALFHRHNGSKLPVCTVKSVVDWKQTENKSADLSFKNFFWEMDVASRLRTLKLGLTRH